MNLLKKYSEIICEISGKEIKPKISKIYTEKLKEEEQNSILAGQEH